MLIGVILWSNQGVSQFVNPNYLYYKDLDNNMRFRCHNIYIEFATVLNVLYAKS
jgi:hypothetical protein